MSEYLGMKKMIGSQNTKQANKKEVIINSRENKRGNIITEEI